MKDFDIIKKIENWVETAKIVYKKDKKKEK